MFMDENPALAEQFRQCWPDVNIVSLAEPFHGIALRFHESVYSPSDEDIPELVSGEVRKVSLRFPDVRIVLLRTECWGGICNNWGQFIRNGQVQVVDSPGGRENKGVLRRLMSNLDVDIGESEIFEPLSRNFRWKAGQ
jgi:hypothetical protein